MSHSFGRELKRGDSEVGIVFVHGLFGDPLHTWGSFPDLVAADRGLSHCDILCWSYPSSPFSVFGALPYLGRSVPPIPEIALALRTALTSGSAAEYDDLILVGHSMGGLVIQKLIVNELVRSDADDRLLNRIRCVALYATPSEGVEARRVLLLHRQTRDLRSTSRLLSELRPEWLQRVYLPRPSDPPQAGRRFIPIKPVVGLEDNAVPLASSKSIYTNVESVPGNHSAMCKPRTRDDLAFQILRRQILLHTCPDWIVGSEKLIAVKCRIADRAHDHLFVIGSRSRDKAYLDRIEHLLQTNSHVSYWRILFGPPRRQELKDHLIRVAKMRPVSERPHGRRTLFLGLYADTSRQQEHNLVGNERACCVVMPSTEGLGEHATGYVTTDRARVDGFFSLVQQMFQASIQLDTIQQVEDLPVVP